MSTKTKIIVIGDARYQIGFLSSEDGSFILMKVMNALREAIMRDAKKTEDIEAGEEDANVSDNRTPEEKTRTIVMGFMTTGGMQDIETHRFIQRKCMSVCSRMETTDGQELPMPIANQYGVTLPEVRDNISVVMKLEIEVLVFNLSSFFAGGGMGALGGSQPLPV